METDKSLEILGNLFSELVKTVGYGKSVLFIIIIVSLFVISKIVIKVIDYIFDSKKKKEQKVEVDKLKEIQTCYITNIGNFFELLEKNNEILSTVIAKLQVSVNLEKFNILIESFIGINRDFMSAIKVRLFNFLESKNKDGFNFVKQDIKNYFYEKIIYRISKFTFMDEVLLLTIKENCIKLIDSFLNKVETIIEKDNIVVKEYINSDEGLFHISQEICKSIELSYLTFLNSQIDITYMKGVN